MDNSVAFFVNSIWLVFNCFFGLFDTRFDVFFFSRSR